MQKYLAHMHASSQNLHGCLSMGYICLASTLFEHIWARKHQFLQAYRQTWSQDSSLEQYLLLQRHRLIWSRLAYRVRNFKLYWNVFDILCFIRCTLFSVQNSNPTIFDYNGPMDAFSKILKREGAAALFDGVGSRIMWLTPRLLIAMSMYDYIKTTWAPQ